MAPLVENSRNFANRQADTGRLSRRGKGIALAFIVIGLLTFVLPIIKFDPPVHGQRYWSDLDITLQSQATLHPETPLALLLFVPFGLVYLTLFVAMGASLARSVPEGAPMDQLSWDSFSCLPVWRTFWGLEVGGFVSVVEAWRRSYNPLGPPRNSNAGRSSRCMDGHGDLAVTTFRSETPSRLLGGIPFSSSDDADSC
jgi:hypothetical protein